MFRSEVRSAALFYLVATLVMTYPVCFRMNTHLAGSGGDGWSYVWNHWWVQYALQHHPGNLLYTQHQFYPATVGLFTITLTLTNCLLVMPIQLLGGPLVAINCFFLFAFWQASFGAYLLLRHLLAHHRAALVGGLIFGFCPYMTAHALGHFNLIATGWLPLFFLAFLRTLESDRWKYPIAAAVLLVLQMYAEFTLGAFAVMLALGWVLLSGRAGLRAALAPAKLARFAVIGVLTVLPLVPYYLAASKDPIVNDIVKQATWFGANEHGAALVGFFLPSELHPIFGPRVRPITSQFYGTAADNTVYVGWIALIAAGYGLWQHRSHLLARRAAVLAIIFAVFALGPTLHIIRAPILNAIPIDDINVTPGMPFVLFHWVPVLRQLRIPTRFVIVTMLMLALLAAMGLAHLEQRLNRPATPRLGQWITALAGLLVLFDFCVLPNNTALADVPDVYRHLGALPKEAVVLDLPFGCRDGLHQYGRIVDKSRYYQSVHERPLIGGYFSRVPDFLIEQYRRVPFLNEVASRVHNPPEPVPCQHAPDADIDAELRPLDIGVVILHRDELDPQTADFIRRHFRQGEWKQEGNVDVYYPHWVQAAVGKREHER